MQFRARAALGATLIVPVAMLVAAGRADAQANQSLTHFGHVATGFSSTPGGRGLSMTAAIEVNAAMMYANMAAGHPTDLEAMKTNVRNVLHALAPAAGSTGPGLGYGVKQAVDNVATHIDRAVQAPGSSQTMKKFGPQVALCAQAVSARAQAMVDLGNKILAAQTAADAAPMAEQLRAMGLALDTGNDANKSGRVDIDAVEPGMNQLEANVYSIFEGEQLPRVIR